MLVLDGACLVGIEPPVFPRIEPPRQEQLQAFVERVAERIGRALERQGLLALAMRKAAISSSPPTPVAHSMI